MKDIFMENLHFKKNISLFYADRFLAGLWELGMLAIVVFQSITNNYITAMAAFSVWEMTRAIFEVPAGYISDKIRRKPIMLTAAFFGTIYVLLIAIAGSLSSAAFLFIGVFFMGLSASLLSGTDTAFLYETLQRNKCEQDFDIIWSKSQIFKQLGIMGGGAIAALIMWKYSITDFVWFILIFPIIQMIVISCIYEPKRTFLQDKKFIKHIKEVFALFFSKGALRSLSSASILEDSLNRAFRDAQSSYLQLLMPTWLLGLGKILRQICGATSFYMVKHVRKFGLINVIIGSIKGEITLRIIGLITNNFITPILFLSSTLFMGTKETATNTMLQNEYPPKLRATVHSCIAVTRSLTMALLMFTIGMTAERFGIRNVVIGMVGLQIISMLNYIRIKSVINSKTI